MAFIGKLLEERAQIRVYDPEAMEKTRALFPSIHYCADPYEVADGSEALMIVTEWENFKQLDWRRIKGLMQMPLVLDGRNFLNSDDMLAMGFEYLGVGIPIAESWGSKSQAGQPT
jgi:UDPglucose 6-dehydrogenase